MLFRSPAVLLMVGVNGTGKTTTTGKLAKSLASSGVTLLLGAADTFRAAAADQLATWGERVGARVVRGAEGADPAKVAAVVADVLGRRRPPRRRSVGKAAERFGVVGKRIMPFRMFEKAAKSSLGA